MSLAAAEHSLLNRLSRLAFGLFEEVDDLPSEVLAFGRPHEHPRTRHLPRFTRTGESLPGTITIRPDCPKPVHGRCECQPDGTWRPFGGTAKADHSAQNLRQAELAEDPDGSWRTATYKRRADGLWVCIRPYRRALDRLRNRNVRAFLVVHRLLDEWPSECDLVAAWAGFAEPVNLAAETDRILGAILRDVDEEMAAEYERNPEWKRRPRSVPDHEKSESQRNAES
jgi:hypothetical protein